MEKICQIKLFISLYFSFCVTFYEFITDDSIKTYFFNNME